MKIKVTRWITPGYRVYYNCSWRAGWDIVARELRLRWVKKVVQVLDQTL